ncbi:hypothetical protein NW806_01135 [Synechococcus sp. W65.1]|uniref:hypothetical protein n=1 Tax=Synechococcus sp. W65.1 TaxID=2964526 RepID=UPI0039C18E9D
MALGGRRGAALAVVLGLSGLAPTLARGEVCASDPQTWSQALTAQLPLFLNLALSRSRSEFQVVLVGQPQVEPLAAKELADSPAASTAQGFCLYFTTLERRLVLPRQPPQPDNLLAGRRSETLHLAYEACVLRDKPGDPWQLVRLRVTGAGIPVRDVTNGLTAQAIRRWQQSGCPLAGDLELTRPSSP